jgi:hypothetical protein
MVEKRFFQTPESLKLVELMRRLGYSSAALAQHIDFTEDSVSNWRVGRWPVPKLVILYLQLLVEFHEQRTGHRVTS